MQYFTIFCDSKRFLVILCDILRYYFSDNLGKKATFLITIFSKKYIDAKKRLKTQTQILKTPNIAKYLGGYIANDILR